MREKLGRADILVMASPTWFGRPSSIAERVLERMDAMISETKDDGLPVAYNKVAGVAGKRNACHVSTTAWPTREHPQPELVDQVVRQQRLDEGRRCHGPGSPVQVRP